MTGIERMAAERQRQIDAEGWTPEHDDEHVLGELRDAARAYLYVARPSADLRIALAPWAYIAPPWWPWHPDWWKPSDDPIRNLEKAGALIAAEIDRLQRLDR